MENASKKLNYVLKSLGIFGFFDSPTKKKLYVVSFYTFVFIIFLGQIIGFLCHDTIHARMEILFYFYCFICLPIYIFQAMRNQHHRLLQCLSSIANEQGHGIDDLRVKVVCLAASKAEVVVLRLMVFCLLGIMPRVVGWCFMPLLDEIGYENVNIQPMPYLFQCTGEGNNLFALKVLCFKINTLKDFILLNSLGALYFLWSLSVSVWPFFFIVCICVFVEANIAVLKEWTEQSDESSSSRLSSGLSNGRADDGENESVQSVEENMAWRNKLVTLIKYHQFIYGIMKDIIPLLQGTCTAILTLNFLSTATLFHIMLKDGDKSLGYLLFEAKTAAALEGILMYLFTCSYCAQLIAEMQTQIGNAVYSMPWYTQDIEFRKQMIRFQILLQQPIILKSYGMYPVNLNLFARVLRASYSAFNLMRAQLR